LHIKIDTKGAKPATSKDGAPSADELIAAFNVPEHRQAAVRREFAVLEKRRKGLDGGILANIPVSASREGGRSLKDRIRAISGGSGIVGLVNGRRAEFVVHEAGVDGALAVGAMMMTAPAPRIDDDAGMRLIGLRFVGQTVIDACIGGGQDADMHRDDAHRYATWLQFVLREGPSDPVDDEMLAELESLCDMSFLDLDAVSSLLISIVERVERDGPVVVTAGDNGMDIVDRIDLQLDLGDILDQVETDPQVIAAIAARRADRRACSRRRSSVRTISNPELPGLFA
tara:strand:+ start:599 stop:1453 length:855 start_codon:yes stop_codon:yes gene_type:complete